MLNVKLHRSEAAAIDDVKCIGKHCADFVDVIRINILDRPVLVPTQHSLLFFPTCNRPQRYNILWRRSVASLLTCRPEKPQDF